MTYAERSGAAIGGAILLAIPVIDAVAGSGVVGPVHFVLGIFGAVLMAAGVSGRRP